MSSIVNHTASLRVDSMAVSVEPRPKRVDPSGFEVYSGTAAFLDVALQYPWGEELRPADVFASAESLDQLRGIPLTIEHPAERRVTPATAKRYAHGAILDAYLRSDSDAPALGVDVIVYTDEAQQAIRRGSYGLSLGYTALGDPAKPSGVHWNHVCLTAPGRVRSKTPTGAAARLDSETADMELNAILDRLPPELRAQVEEALAVEASETPAGADDSTPEDQTTEGQAPENESDTMKLEDRLASLEEQVTKLLAATRNDSTETAVNTAVGQVEQRLRLARATDRLGIRLDSLSVEEHVAASVAAIAERLPQLSHVAKAAAKSGDIDVIVGLLDYAKTRVDSAVADDNHRRVADVVFAAPAQGAQGPDLSKIRI